MFAAAVRNQTTFTENGMPSLQSSGSAVTDLFYNIGAMRGKDPVPAFAAAFGENMDYALRIALWARDVRGGAGERKLFRDILLWLEMANPAAAALLALKVPEVGRWDDLLVFNTPELKHVAYALIRQALQNGNGLCAKWMPRKGAIAEELRTFIGLNHRAYRKLLVGLTTVVETQMCAKNWDEINFSHVPSVAASQYRKAFFRNTQNFAQYVEDLKNKVKGVKTNSAALYPHQLIAALDGNRNPTLVGHIQAQWDALPNYVGDTNVLAMVDVSGSMTTVSLEKSTITAADVALSLGLYVADKNKGPFKDTFLTFSGDPELLHLRGNLVEKLAQMDSSKWGMNTDLDKAINLILQTAITHKVPRGEMPKILLILSDMQFDASVKHDLRASQMLAQAYEVRGYEMPKVVFWNLNAHDDVPVNTHQMGFALVSGFSPAILKAVLADKLEYFTPTSVMMETLANPRYDYR